MPFQTPFWPFRSKMYARFLQISAELRLLEALEMSQHWTTGRTEKTTEQKVHNVSREKHSLLLHLIGLHGGSVSQWAARQAAVGGEVPSHMTRAVTAGEGTSHVQLVPTRQARGNYLNKWLLDRGGFLCQVFCLVKWDGPTGGKVKVISCVTVLRVGATRW